MQYGGHQGDRHLRLFRKEKVILSHKIHEPPKVSGKTGILSCAFDHYSTPTILEYERKLQAYTDREAERMHEDGIRFCASGIMLKPLAKFFYQYVVQLGFLDGIEGLIYYGLSSFYMFVKYAKLREKECQVSGVRCQEIA